MKAVVYKGPHNVAVEEVADPQIDDSTDIILKVTSAAICGSDLHMYGGRTIAEPGLVFGHEIMGIVHAVGESVKTLKKGDRVVLPFNIGCGMCKHCQKGFSNACLIVNPDAVGAGYGYVGMGPQKGGQAEYVHVPFADFNALKLPGQPFDDHEDDFLLIADILPTGWHSLNLAHFQPGGIVVIYGAGPVGLLAAQSALHRGAAMVYVVDGYEDRLAKAKEIGAIPVNFCKGSSVEQIQNQIKNNKALQDRKRVGEEKIKDILYGIDAIGYESKDEKDISKDNPTQVLDNLVKLLDPTGHIGIIGVFLPQDPGGINESAKKGRYEFDFGLAWNKGLTIGTGQTPVKMYDRELRDLVIAGKIKPSVIVSHHIKIDEAPDFYKNFDTRETGYIKGIIQFK